MANSDPRKVILARRAKFVAAALASLATAATCGGKAVVDGPLDQGMGGQTSTGDGAGGLGPHVCLSDVGGKWWDAPAMPRQAAWWRVALSGPIDRLGGD